MLKQQEEKTTINSENDIHQDYNGAVDDQSDYQSDYDYDGYGDDIQNGGSSQEDDSDLDSFIDQNEYDLGDDEFYANPNNVKRPKRMKKKNKANELEEKDNNEGIEPPMVIGKNYHYKNSICAF